MKSISSNPETVYQCPDDIVVVVRKKSGLRRFPKHDYACVLFVLRPKDGTRVCTLRNGLIEYMPSFDELRAMLGAIDPKLVKKLPLSIRNKPRARKKFFDVANARRQLNRVSQ